MRPRTLEKVAAFFFEVSVNFPPYYGVVSQKILVFYVIRALLLYNWIVRKTLNVRNDSTNTVKPADNGTAWGGVCSVEYMFRLIQVLEVKEHRSSESFPLKKGFRSLHVLFQTVFTVPVNRNA